MSEQARFQVQDILPLALTIVVAGVGIAYGLNVLGDTKDDFGETSCAGRGDGFTTYSASASACSNGSHTSPPGDYYYNATTDSLTATGKFPDKLGLIVTVIVAAILIGILVRYLMVR